MNKFIELLTGNPYFLFLIMVVLHVIADYICQTDVMAKYKQKKSWDGLAKQYEYDYIVFLCVHSILWSAIVFLPLLFYTNYNTVIYYDIVMINTIIHMIIDDLKCNKLKINLIVDQVLHLIQMQLTIVLVNVIPY
jgi:hypothetical protein